MAAVAEDWHVLMRAEAHGAMLDAVHAHGDQRVRKSLYWHMEKPPRPSADDYMAALARRATWLRRWNTFLDRYPLVLCPVSLAPPFIHGADVSTDAGFNEIVRTQAPLFAVALLGLPAVSVPTGLQDGLPTGVQIIAQRFREDLVLDAAQAIERQLPMATPVEPEF
jgi:amidase